MNEPKQGKKPEMEGCNGTEKPGADTGEAGGRSKRPLYVCFNDETPNYTDCSCGYFTCWKCGALNYMH